MDLIYFPVYNDWLSLDHFSHSMLETGLITCCNKKACLQSDI